MIVCFNPGADLGGCIEALAPGHWAEVILVDNASSDGSVEAAAARWGELTIVRSATNLGFAGGANLGARHATGSSIIFLNPDTYAPLASLQLLVDRLARAPGVTGPLVHLQRANEDADEAGAVVDVLGLPRGLRPGDGRPPLYVPGCCLATDRECFEDIGGFDERYFMFAEDVEYCWQVLRRGLSVSVVGGAVVEHLGGSAAPGGYRACGDPGGLEISVARVLLRERNTTAMLLACAPGRWLPLLMVGSVVRATAFAWLLWRLGARRSIGGLARGLRDVARWAPGVLRRRWSPGVSRRGSEAAWARVAKRPFFLDHLGAAGRSRLVGTLPRGVGGRAWEEAVGKHREQEVPQEPR